MRASLTVTPTEPTDICLIRTVFIVAYSFCTLDRLALRAREVLPTHAALTDGQTAALDRTNFQSLFSPMFCAYPFPSSLRRAPLHYALFVLLIMSKMLPTHSSLDGGLTAPTLTTWGARLYLSAVISAKFLCIRDQSAAGYRTVTPGVVSLAETTHRRQAFASHLRAQQAGHLPAKTAVRLRGFGIVGI